jgi:hypothetical protein
MRPPRVALVLALWWGSATPAAAQLTRDIQFHALASFFSDRFVGAGVGYALRPPGRIRYSLAGSGGEVQGALAGRLEGLVSFHLNAGKERGFAPYAAAGVAAMITGSTTQAYLEIVLGLEERPGRPSGWFAEAGLGGGMRIAAGYRLRSGSGIRLR